MLSTSTPIPADYMVGNSTMTSVTCRSSNGVYLVADLYLFSAPVERNIISDGPEEMVLAREFEKGRVVYRMTFWRNPAFFSRSKLKIELDAPMRPVEPTDKLAST